MVNLPEFHATERAHVKLSSAFYVPENKTADWKKQPFPIRLKF